MKNYYQENAFRILGISADANNSVVRKAHQSLRTRVKMNGVKEVQDWLAFIDKRQLSETTVQNALHRLENPKTRLEDRIFWIFNPNDSSGAYENLSFNNIRETINMWKSSPLVTAQANVARLYYILCVCADQGLVEPTLWQTAFQTWQFVISKNEFWENLIDVEMESGFEVMFSPREIMAYKSLIWPMLLEYTPEYLQKALISNNFNNAEKHLIVLSTSNIPNTVTDSIKEKFLESLLEEVEKSVKQTLNQLYEKLDRADNDKERLVACDTALQFCEDYLLTRLEFFGKTNSEYFLEKTRRLVVSCLRKLSISYYNEIENLAKCEYVLNKARKLAENTFLVEQIDKDHCTVLGTYIENIASDVLEGLTPTTKEEVAPISTYEKSYKLFSEELVPKLEELNKFSYAYQEKYIKAKETSGLCLKFVSLGFIRPGCTYEKSILLLKQAIQLAEGTEVEQSIKLELLSVEKKQKEIEYSKYIINSNKACIVETKRESIKVPPICTCCLKETNDEEKLVYTWQTGNTKRSVSFFLPLCQECLAHRHEYNTKQIMMFAIIILGAVVAYLFSSSFFPTNPTILSLFILSSMVITFQFFNKKIPLTLLNESHATRDKSAQIVGVSKFQFLNPTYAQLFARANSVPIQERWVWKHSSNVHFPLLSRASFNVFFSFIIVGVICLYMYNNSEIGARKPNTAINVNSTATNSKSVDVTSSVATPVVTKPVEDSKGANKVVIRKVPVLDLEKNNKYKDSYTTTNSFDKHTTPNYEPLSNNSNTELQRLKVEIEQYRINLQEQEREVDKLTETLNSHKSRLDQLAEQISKIESDNKAGLSIDRNDYENMINQHNRHVEVYNKLLYDYKAKYAVYQQNLQEVNNKINTYNKLVGR